MNIRALILASLCGVAGVSFGQTQISDQVGTPETLLSLGTRKVSDINHQSLSDRSEPVLINSGQDDTRLSVVRGSTSTDALSSFSKSNNSFGDNGVRSMFSTSGGFLGISSSESGSFPPDAQGDVSPIQVVLATNGRVKSFDKSGNVSGIDASLNSFFDSVRNNSTAVDPHVKFDRLTNRWFITAVNTSNTHNRILVAVSSGATITNNSSFAFFYVSGAGTFFGLPSLGVDNNGLYIGGNLYSSCYGSFSTSKVVFVQKGALTGGTGAAFSWTGLCGSWGGGYCPQGVDNDDPSSTTGYVLGVDSIWSNRLALRRITNADSTHPSISGNISINVADYDLASLSIGVQGSNRPVSIVDDRLSAAHMSLNAATGKRTLFVAHTTSLDKNGVASDHEGVFGTRWYELDNLDNGHPTVPQTGTVYDPSSTGRTSYFVPSIAANLQGNVAIGFTYGGSNSLLGAGFAYHTGGAAAGSTSFASSLIGGQGNYNVQTNSTQAWGHTSSTVIDPADGMTAWTFQQYCSADNEWGIRVVKLASDAPATIDSISPTTGYQGTTTTVNVIGTSVDGSGFFEPGASYPSHLTATLSGTGVTVSNVQFIDATHFTFDVTVDANAPAGPRTLTVTNPDGQQVTLTDAFTVQAVSVGSVTLPASIAGGGSATGTVTLVYPAPAGGATITLSSDNAGLTVPATVTIPEGETSVDFTVNSTIVNTVTNATVTASANGSSSSATISVNPPVVTGVSVNPTSISGMRKKRAVLTVTIANPAPVGGLVLVGSSSNPSLATIPASITILAGATTAKVNVTTYTVTGPTNVTLSVASGPSTASTVLEVTIPKIQRIKANILSLRGGNSGTATATIWLNAPAPAGGTQFDIVLSTPLLTVPATVTVPEGALYVSFDYTAPISVLTDKKVNITAKQTGTTYSQKVQITVLAPTMKSVFFNKAQVVGGSPAALALTVRIYAPAPVGGLTVTLVSSDPAALEAPATVFFPEGQSSVTLAIVHHTVATSETVTVTGSYNGSTTSTTIDVNAH